MTVGTVLPDLLECKHGRRGQEPPQQCCLDWPAPDSMGRHHCIACGCFTAATDRIHSWCRR